MTEPGSLESPADPSRPATKRPVGVANEDAQPHSFPNRLAWDVIVIGAGPAGSLVSRLLAQRGNAVLLIDAKEFPRDKVCGGCLSARAVANLAQAGLGELPTNAGAVPLDAFEVHIGGRLTRYSMSGGYSLSRRTLDQHLLNAAIAVGVHFVPQTMAVIENDCIAGRRVVTARRGSHVSQFDSACVVCADGLLRSAARQLPELAAETSPRSHLGIGACLQHPGLVFEEHVRPGTIAMAVSHDGYAGLARCENGRLSIAAAISPTSLRSAKSPAAVLKRVLASAGLPFVDDADSIDWQGTPLLTSHARTVATERVFVIGDAAGYVEPFTGEGMANALESAWLSAPLIDQAIRQWDPQLAQDWNACYARAIRQRQWPVRTLGAMLRYPNLSRMLLRIGQSIPMIPRWLISRINDPRPCTVTTESHL